ncbi:Glycosyl transferase, family 25 [Metarhizium guizhouense ARSEF 977]|uniref:Glycosyl transferase, family 25 n=1 Tax=Metarhizium guizhouense (strain ARSEF 977) TaxID=1276136 RepID=A0A0B4G604_METGA|nr:Glycosyl transferase, family 25 [Metarhizium guizhouense ARSEF 977]
MSTIESIVAFSRSHASSNGTLSCRSPLFRLLVTALIFFALSTLFIFATGPVADRSALWLPSSRTNGQNGPSAMDREHYPPVVPTADNDAGNSTLGFSSIYFIYLPSRYDRLDAMSLQSYLSGVDLTEYPAVGPQLIKDVGMPPTRKPGKLRTSEQGCWRAHANIWSTMLRQKLPPLLIVESDATWDINIRKIMPNLNNHFRQFLKEINSTQLHNPAWPAEAVARNESTRTSDDDPWLSSHWDILSFGQCHETDENNDIRLIYNDPFVPLGKDYQGRALTHERVIRRSGGITCTTAYAVSQTGAAKLLLRTAVNLDMPVDMVMQEMIVSGDLVSYSVMPPIMAQWQYAEGIGMEERGANSNINKAGMFSGLFSLFARKKAWENVKASGSVWTTKTYHEDVAFDEMSLQGAWKRVFRMGN